MIRNFLETILSEITLLKKYNPDFILTNYLFSADRIKKIPFEDNNLKNILPNEMEDFLNNSRIDRWIADSRDITSIKQEETETYGFVFIKGEKYNPYDHFEQIITENCIAAICDMELITEKHIKFIRSFLEKRGDDRNSDGEGKNKLPDYFLLIHTNDSKLLSGFIFKNFRNNPDKNLTMIGVTGTDGKTSVVNIARQFFSAYGESSASIGTLGITLDSEKLPFSFSTPTTPEIWDLYAALENLTKKGCSDVFIELTSIGYSTKRIQALELDGLIFTNMTQDHLDFHKTLENYYQAKLNIIDILHNSGKENKWVLANHDDSNFPLVKDSIAKYKDIRLFTYGKDKKSDIQILEISELQGNMDITFNLFGEKIIFKTGLIGLFNAYNIACVLGIYFLKNGKQPQFSGQVIPLFIPGRMEKINFVSNNSIFIDYAHTEKSLANALELLRNAKYKKIIVVFGCGGDRDRIKRPKMGKTAQNLADILIITSDNPRTEDPEFIISEIVKGLDKKSEFDISFQGDRTGKNIIIEKERKRAIMEGIKQLNRYSDSALLIAGKGHEEYQEINGVKYPFSDKEYVLKCIEMITGEKK